MLWYDILTLVESKVALFKKGRQMPTNSQLQLPTMPEDKFSYGITVYYYPETDVVLVFAAPSIASHLVYDKEYSSIFGKFLFRLSRALVFSSTGKNEADLKRELDRVVHIFDSFYEWNNC